MSKRNSNPSLDHFWCPTPDSSDLKTNLREFRLNGEGEDRAGLLNAIFNLLTRDPWSLAVREIGFYTLPGKVPAEYRLYLRARGANTGESRALNAAVAGRLKGHASVQSLPRFEKKDGVLSPTPKTNWTEFLFVDWDDQPGIVSELAGLFRGHGSIHRLLGIVHEPLEDGPARFSLEAQVCCWTERDVLNLDAVLSEWKPKKGIGEILHHPTMPLMHAVGKKPVSEKGDVGHL